jgi:hypothetical protein
MALMAMPTIAAAIGSILAVISEMTLTTNPMVDNTTATSQTHQLLTVNRPNASTNDAIHRISIPRGMNNACNSVKIGPLACAIAVSSVVIPQAR